MADETGLLSKYAELFDSIGSPHQTDIFKREGEILSSISFGCRYWERQQGFVPLIDTRFIADHLNRLAQSHSLYGRHQAAMDIVSNLKTGSDEYDSLGFVFSNYLVTLHEQRRRYGQIKQVEPETGNLFGELNPFDPDFLCFFIELHHKILESGNSRRSAIDSVHILLESYLQSVVCHDLAPGSRLIISTTDMSARDQATNRISQASIDWLTQNPMFSTIKERMKL